MPKLDEKTYELWEGFNDGAAILQTVCDAEGCDKGLVYAPVRFCGRCGGSGYQTRRMYLRRCPHENCERCEDE